MSLLKNEVGRPSNKTIRNRKILKVVLSVLAFALAFGLGAMLGHYSKIRKEEKANNKVSVIYKIDEVTKEVL